MKQEIAGLHKEYQQKIIVFKKQFKIESDEWEKERARYVAAAEKQ